jgi:ATP-dependent RNA helicase DDX23/PRP28
MDISSLSPEEQAEALRLQQIAERAERKAAERNRLQLTSSNLPSSSSSSTHSNSTNHEPTSDVKYLSKKEREELALKRLEEQRLENERKKKEAFMAHENFITGKNLIDREKELQEIRKKEIEERKRREKEENIDSKEFQHEIQSIKEHYLGGPPKKKRVVKQSEKLVKLFKFDWEQEDDTARSDMNPLYNNRVKINALFGRGYIAGIDQREQRKESNFIQSLSQKRLDELRRMEDLDDQLTEEEKARRQHQRELATIELQRRQAEELEHMEQHSSSKSGTTVSVLIKFCLHLTSCCFRISLVREVFGSNDRS